MSQANNYYVQKKSKNASVKIQNCHECLKRFKKQLHKGQHKFKGQVVKKQTAK